MQHGRVLARGVVDGGATEEGRRGAREGLVGGGAGVRRNVEGRTLENFDVGEVVKKGALGEQALAAQIELGQEGRFFFDEVGPGLLVEAAVCRQSGQGREDVGGGGHRGIVGKRDRDGRGA